MTTAKPDGLRPQTMVLPTSQDGWPQNAGCAIDVLPVTPNDTAVFNPTYRALYIGVTGDVKVRTVSGHDATFANHPVGYLYAMVDRVYATGTTASSILGLV